jgi:hypothetical protein
MKRKEPQRDVEKERFLRGVIRRQRQSGQSTRGYCRGNALSEPSFYAWRQELKWRSSQRASAMHRRRALPVARQHSQVGTRQRAADTTAFVPVWVAAETWPWPDREAIELALPSGAVLRQIASQFWWVAVGRRHWCIPADFFQTDAPLDGGHHMK